MASHSDVSRVMAGWPASPGHCANIMSGNYTGPGAGSACDSGSTYETCWTQVFARPR